MRAMFTPRRVSLRTVKYFVVPTLDFWEAGVFTETSHFRTRLVTATTDDQPDVFLLLSITTNCKQSWTITHGALGLCAK